MLPYRDSRLTRIALVIFFVLLAGYGYFEARGLLFGPSITVTPGVTDVHDPFVVIAGHADRISSLSMNGKAIPVTEKGDFSEPYLLSPGYNRITLDARDRYGRSRSQAIEVVYTPADPEAPAEPSDTAGVSGSASSTPIVAPQEQ